MAPEFGEFCSKADITPDLLFILNFFFVKQILAKFKLNISCYNYLGKMHVFRVAGRLSSAFDITESHVFGLLKSY